MRGRGLFFLEKWGVECCPPYPTPPAPCPPRLPCPLSYLPHSPLPTDPASPTHLSLAHTHLPSHGPVTLRRCAGMLGFILSLLDVSFVVCHLRIPPPLPSGTPSSPPTPPSLGPSRTSSVTTLLKLPSLQMSLGPLLFVVVSIFSRRPLSFSVLRLSLCACSQLISLPF
jgi:hypothetical protein